MVLSRLFSRYRCDANMRFRVSMKKSIPSMQSKVSRVKRSKRFVGFKECLDEEYKVIAKFLDNYKSLSNKRYTIGNAWCLGKDIRNAVYNNIPSELVIDMFIERVRILSEDGGFNGIIFLKSDASINLVGTYGTSDECIAANFHIFEKLVSSIDSVNGEVKKILVPVHYGDHWSLLEADFVQRVFRNYNTLASDEYESEAIRWMEWMKFGLSNRVIGIVDWPFEVVDDYPQTRFEEDYRASSFFMLMAIQGLAFDQGIEYCASEFKKIRAIAMASILNMAM